MQLYPRIIIEHNKSPKNFGRMNDATEILEATIPSCGDQFKLYIKKEGDLIQRIMFDGDGCALSKSSSSIMITKIEGKTISDVTTLINNFVKILKTKMESCSIDDNDLVALFDTMKNHPGRDNCILLSWVTIQEHLVHRI